MKCQAEKRPLVSLWTKQLLNAPVTHKSELWHLPGYSANTLHGLPQKPVLLGNMQKSNLSVWFKSHYRFTFYSETIIY